MEFDKVAKPTRIMDTCERQVNKAIKYLEQNSPKQAVILKLQFRNIVDKIGRQPGIGTKYKKGMRKIKLGKFRYHIFWNNVYYK